MKNKQSATNAKLYSPRATLCAIGIKLLRSLKFFDSIAEHVKVRQKTIAALERAFGRDSCAEQSVVQKTRGRLRLGKCAPDEALSKPYCKSIVVHRASLQRSVATA